MIYWPVINKALKRWMIGMAAVVIWFMTSSLGCSLSACSDAVLININLIGLCGIILVGGCATVALMRADTRLLFTPLVSYAAATVLFFGFGPMSTFLANEATQRFQAYSIYTLTPEQSLRTNLLSSVGIMVSVGAILLCLPRKDRSVPFRPVLSKKRVALIFLAVGLILKHLVIMPSIYGTSTFVIPGMLRNLRYLPDLGFAMAAMFAAQGNMRWKILFWVLWPWHLLLAFPEFSKKSVMLTMLLPAVGSFIGHRSFRKLAIWGTAAIVLFTSLQNINAISRWSVNEAKEYKEVLSVPDRFRLLLESGVSRGNIDEFLPAAKVGVDTWWLRLNFSGPQAAAMNLYDNGVSSTFTQNILIYLVPRILWPGKPVIASPGQAFHATVTGNANNQTKVGITVFADGYWKMGWFGVVAWSTFAGAVFALMTRLTLSQIGTGRYLYLPAAMLGLQMGATGMTAFLQNAIISALPVYFGFCFVVFLFYRGMIYLVGAQSQMYVKSSNLSLQKQAES